MENNLKDYAVVMLGYKHPSNLYQRIDELKKQTHPPKEVILLINYYPNDVTSTIEHFAKTETFITFWGRFSQNIGIAYAWNLGLKISKQPVTVVLNDDCQIFPETMERLIRPFENYRNVGVTGVIPGNNPTDEIQTPQGFLLAFNNHAVKSGNFYYDEKANPLACERELCLRMAAAGWDIVFPLNVPYQHVHDISNHPETSINYLNKEWIPLRDQPLTENYLKEKIDIHNKNIRYMKLNP